VKEACGVGRAFSVDLRERVVAAIDSGLSIAKSSVQDRRVAILNSYGRLA
jgi:hypothetical protein